MGQTLSKVYTHLVFSTKNRERDIFPKFRDEMYNYMAGILKNLDCHVRCIGGDMDHVHILFCLSRKKTISEIVRTLKRSTSVWYQNKLGTSFHWQSGYGIFSIGQSQVDKLVNYINHQEEHHKRKTFKEELLQILEAYEMEYYEKYLWD